MCIAKFRARIESYVVRTYAKLEQINRRFSRAQAAHNNNSRLTWLERCYHDLEARRQTVNPIRRSAYPASTRT